MSSDGTFAACCGTDVLGSMVGFTYRQWAGWRSDRNLESPEGLKMDVEQVL